MSAANHDDDFDNLEERVNELERRHDAAMELIAAEVVGLHAHLDQISGHVNGISGDLVNLATDTARGFGQVTTRIDDVVTHVRRMDDRFSAQLELHGRLLGRIIDAIDPDPEPDLDELAD